MVKLIIKLFMPYLIDRAVKQYNIPSSQAAFLVSIMGIANVCSRLAFGWIGKANVTSLWLFNFGVIHIRR